MSISCTWNRLPGPADFLDTIIEDLVGGNTVLVGIPDTMEVSVLCNDRRNRQTQGDRSMGCCAVLGSASINSKPIH